MRIHCWIFLSVCLFSFSLSLYCCYYLIFFSWGCCCFVGVKSHRHGVESMAASALDHATRLNELTEWFQFFLFFYYFFFYCCCCLVSGGSFLLCWFGSHPPYTVGGRGLSRGEQRLRPLVARDPPPSVDGFVWLTWFGVCGVLVGCPGCWTWRGSAVNPVGSPEES